MAWDQIPLSWRNYLKFLLEMASISFAVAPLRIFLLTNRLADKVLATIFCLSVAFISLVIMRIIEKEMYEVLKGMIRGTIWFNRACLELIKRKKQT